MLQAKTGLQERCYRNGDDIRQTWAGHGIVFQPPVKKRYAVQLRASEVSIGLVIARPA